MPTTQDIVQKLWNLCNILKDDGITYHEYVTELTFLLFLKMAQETGAQKTLPAGYRWSDLESKNEADMLTFYRGLLLHLGTEAKDARVQAIFANASTSIRLPRHLRELVTQIDAIDWFEAREEGILADLYEGLLEKNASETKTGAGQYFTARPLIDSMVAVTKPQPGEIIQDPAAGTLGFIVAADREIKRRTQDLSQLSEKEQEFQIHQAYVAVELVPDTHRHALMNALLHGIYCPIHLGDTLGTTGEHLPKADLILTNPPFGTKKGGGLPSRTDFTFRTSNKQFAFLQHIYRGLKPGGRAAVVLPDNVLFEENIGARIRADLMDKCDLHTILRLPTGIFYAQGVKTNVLFFTRGRTDKGHTRQVWVYDLRANMPSFGKRTPLTRDHFREFEQAYGSDPHGGGKRMDQGETGRFRCFTREAIKERGENLDLSWLKDGDSANHDDLPQPKAAVSQVLKKLQVAVKEIQHLQRDLARS
jgi:type I restriction enzyme M protein